MVTGEGHSGATYMVTGGEPMSFAASTQALQRGYRQVRGTAARKAFLEAGRPQWLVDVLLELFAAFGTGAVGLKTSTFTDLTGLKPQSFSSFAEEVAAAEPA